MAAEKTIVSLRAKYLPILMEAFEKRVARLEMNVYIDLLIRAMFAKPWPEDLEPRLKCPMGT